MSLSNLLFFMLVSASTLVGAAEQIVPFQKDVHYQELTPPQPIAMPGKVEVIEFLWYGCESCYLIQPELQKWVSTNRDRINYIPLPAVTDENMLILARAFYAAEALGIREQTHQPLFTAIHRHHRDLNNEQVLKTFFEEHGVESKDFIRSFRSSFVGGRVRHARILSKRYNIIGAPSIIINGKYRVDPSMVSSPKELIEVVDFLVKKESVTGN